MATSYKTPGVYPEEISVFPPAIAQVETAVPAFIGYTERAARKGRPLTLVPTRLTSLVEYEESFGSGPNTKVKSLKLDDSGTVSDIVLTGQFHLYESLKLFFANGGSQCWIVSLGGYNADAKDADFSKGLDAIRAIDEPTLLVIPDAVLLDDGLYNVQTAALRQAADLMDRFCILDLRATEDSVQHVEFVEEFRNKCGINNLSYGAAYTPHLRSAFGPTVSYENVRGTDLGGGSKLDFADSKLVGTDGPAKTAADLLNKALTDKADYGKAIVVSLGAGKSFDDVYRAKQADFAAALAVHNPDTDAPTTALRRTLVAAVDLGYKTLDDLADNAAAGNSVITTALTGEGSSAPMLREEIRASGKPAGRLGKLVLRLNKLTITGDGVGGGKTLAPEDLTERYKIKKPLFTAPDWETAFDDATVGAVVPDYYTALPAVAGGAATAAEIAAANAARRTAMKNNLIAGERELAKIWQEIKLEIETLQRAASELLTTYERTSLERLPKARLLLDSVSEMMSLVPPSGAVAGVYCAMDAREGVHHAPANVSLDYVSGLGVNISHDAQKDLNVDVVAGKSINAIRPFTGKGILVWGARTLAGNDNEWRYVSVRRVFNMIEESTKKATEAFVFKPNDANTWTKVKAMIENFLRLQWRAGALAGATPEHAYRVKVGLGQTMTPDDVLNGLLIVEIAMAVVRPSEFIILRFSHKMQEA